MLRDLDRLSAGTFDLLVVGGGIHGLACAYDAAQRGLSVALIERDDFGSGASFNHLKTLHGGLRYLQTLDLGRARESVFERRAIARIAPQTVRPLLYVLPLFRSLVKGKAAMRAGFLLDRFVAFDKNRDVPEPLRLPPGRVLSRQEAITRFPLVARDDLTGAALWYDYQMVDADRLTFLFAAAAVEHGAILANHLEGVAPVVERGRGLRVVGVRATDTETGRDVQIAARLTLNATGAGVDQLLKPLGLRAGVPLLKAMNLVTRRESDGEAVGGRAISGRHLFLVPWRGRTLFGTWESPGICEAGPASATSADVAAFVAELNEVFPSLGLTVSEVTLVHRALVPAAVRRDGRVGLEGHERLLDHAAHGSSPIEGLITLAGVKYTTARGVAERIVDRVLEKLGRERIPCRTASVPLPGSGLVDVDLAVAAARHRGDWDVPPDTIRHLIGSYGLGYDRVLEIAESRPEWRSPVSAESPVIGAELALAAREEMALTLVDAAVRRTSLGALGHPGDEAARRAAAIVGAERGWSAERINEEIRRLEEFYRIG
jgi:glycerol-3-phosphate dehydrogenase